MNTWHQVPETLDCHWFVSIEAMAASRFPQGPCVRSVKDESNGSESGGQHIHQLLVPYLRLSSEPGRYTDM